MLVKTKIPFFESKHSAILRYIVAIFVIIGAASLRIWPLGALELRIPWVTFYPAVMAAALYGGFASGILATALSALVVLFWSPTNLPFIDDPGDWLGMAVFSVNGMLISLMSGAMHRARNQATKAKDQAEAANQAKSVFLANMSHELRTPLNAILGFANLMQKDSGFNKNQVEKLHIISSSGENLLHLINNVLDISKIEAGHIIREDGEANLSQLLIEIESMMYLKINEKKLGFKLSPSPDIPQNIIVDVNKLRQILINLIANAIKYTEKGYISLEVIMEQRETPWLVFKVKDTGIGVDADNQEIIFSPFEQIGDQPAKEAGTGLGLAICKQFVELMEGHISVFSQPGKGSTFMFEIPIKSIPVSDSTSANIGSKQIIGLETGQQRFRLLIAEDKLENRLLLKSLLEPFDFNIKEVTNGKEAVEISDQWKPHLIWMDIRMPVMDGKEATRLIKASDTNGDIKIIALTAHALEDERGEILEAGCDAFIRKPYRDTDIFDALSKHLGIRFAYSNSTVSDDNKTIDIKDAHFDQVPSDLIKTLQKYVILLDEDNCLIITGKISEYNHELGLNLRQKLENLEYKQILTILDKLLEET